MKVASRLSAIAALASFSFLSTTTPVKTQERLMDTVTITAPPSPDPLQTKAEVLRTQLHLAREGKIAPETLAQTGQEVLDLALQTTSDNQELQAQLNEIKQQLNHISKQNKETQNLILLTGLLLNVVIIMLMFKR